MSIVGIAKVQYFSSNRVCPDPPHASEICSKYHPSIVSDAPYYADFITYFNDLTPTRSIHPPPVTPFSQTAPSFSQTRNFHRGLTRCGGRNSKLGIHRSWRLSFALPSSHSDPSHPNPGLRKKIKLIFRSYDRQVERIPVSE